MKSKNKNKGKKMLTLPLLNAFVNPRLLFIKPAAVLLMLLLYLLFDDDASIGV